ncbi:MAG: LTA synthase family protein [Lachnospiraceae bacterium]
MTQYFYLILLICFVEWGVLLLGNHCIRRSVLNRLSLAFYIALDFVILAIGVFLSVKGFGILQWFVGLVPLFFIGNKGVYQEQDNNCSKKSVKLVAAMVLFLLSMIVARSFSTVKEMFCISENLDAAVRLSAIIFLTQFAVYFIASVIKPSEKKGIFHMVKACEDEERLSASTLAVYFIVFQIALIVIGKMVLSMGMLRQENLYGILNFYYGSSTHILNIFYVMLISLGFYELFGKGIACVLSTVVFLFLYIANYIKLLYHNTFFSWLDMLQMKEALLMGKEFFLSVKNVVLVVIVSLILLSLLIYFRKKIVIFLKPHFEATGAVLSIVLLIFFSVKVYDGQFEVLGIQNLTWENEKVNVDRNGLVLNLILNAKVVDGAVQKQPENYKVNTAGKLKKEFDVLNTKKVSATKPDVIVILGESLFDLQNVDGINITPDISSNIRKYSNTKLISSRYGGYTSAIEFEVLTGMSLAFMPDALTPYTTYFNKVRKDFSSVPFEFKKNGYVTKAIHPDLREFYNRDVVYESMGFDSYLDIHDFDTSEGNITKNGWILDSVFADKLIEELGKGDTPQFIFGITMEEHYVTQDKYDNVEVQVAVDGADESVRHEVEQQAQSYFDTDKMVEKLVDYMDQTDRPTLLYIFGDHLPPMEALTTLGYINDLENKYRTSFVMYSNYKELDTGVDALTPNQIAAQVVLDAEIEHSSYFDYLYSLRQKYPVIHKEFMDAENQPELQDYKFLQYDLLFGQQYLAEKK